MTGKNYVCINSENKKALKSVEKQTFNLHAVLTTEREKHLRLTNTVNINK